MLLCWAAILHLDLCWCNLHSEETKEDMQSRLDVSVECAPSGHYSRICLDRGGRILGEQTCECQEKNAEHASSLTPDLLSSGLETVTSSSLLLPLQQLSVGDWAQHRVSSVNGQKHISMKRCTRRWSWKGEEAKFKSGKLLDFSINPLSKLFSNASTCEHIFMYLCIHVDDEIISTNYRSAVR